MELLVDLDEATQRARFISRVHGEVAKVKSDAQGRDLALNPQGESSGSRPGESGIRALAKAVVQSRG